MPSAADVRFDTDRDQVVLTINGETQPFDNLSAGQRMMVALVADLAIKAVTQNAFLVTSEELEADPAKLPLVLQETTGLVLIDELDVHLHPKWQRRVAKDLKTTFPGIQFVCTSHSPQVLGELEPEEIRLMGDAGVTIPPRSFGIDSSRILEEIMDAPARNEDVDARLRQLFHLIDQERFAEARSLVSGLTEELGEGDPDITRADALMTFLETDE